MNRTAAFRFLVSSVAAGTGVAPARSGEAGVFETKTLRLAIDPNGNVRQLYDLSAGTDYVGKLVPFCTAKVGSQTIVPDRVAAEGDRLRFGFARIGTTATLRIQSRPRYLIITVERVEGTPDELRFVNLATRAAQELLAGRIVCIGERRLGLVGSDPAVRIMAFGTGTGILASAVYPGLPGPPEATRWEGRRVALFACGRDELYDVIASIEREFGIPGGVEAKLHPANRESYLMLRDVDFSASDRLIEYAREGGFGSILLIHGTWCKPGWRFSASDPGIPGGLGTLKRFNDKVHAAGMTVGVHVFPTMLRKDGDYVRPKPDPRLYKDMVLTLAADAAPRADRIATREPPTDWPRLAGNRDVQIGDEILSYSDLSMSRPYGLVGCERGKYGTTAAAHRAGAKVAHVATGAARSYFLTDPRTDIWDEMARGFAGLYEAVGFDWVYFDGAEIVPEPYWYTIPRGEAVYLRALPRRPVVVQASGEGPFTWHLITRTGQRDYFRVSKDPKEEVDDAIQRSVARARQGLMAADIGWFPLKFPDGRYASIDEVEYLYVKALAANAAVSIQASPAQLESLPHRGPILGIARTLEELRLSGYFSDGDRKRAMEPGADFMLIQDGRGRYHLARAREIPLVAGTSREVRAFLAEPVEGVQTASWWNVGPPVWLELPTPANTFEITDAQKQAVQVQALPGGRVRVPVTTRLYAKLDNLSRPDETFRAAKVAPIR